MSKQPEPQPVLGPRTFRVCVKCGGALRITAEAKAPDGTTERNKRCVKCGTDHLDTVKA